MIRPVRVDELELGTNLVRGDLGLQVIHHSLQPDLAGPPQATNCW